MSPRPFTRRRGQQGYTLVEIMMALAIFMVAMLGMFTMQKAAVSANSHARSAGVAQHLARAWASQLEVDATQWRATKAGDWLNGVGEGAWTRPAYVLNRKFGSRFDALGNPLTDAAADQALTRFCTNVRLTPLPLDTMGMAGNGVLRAEIRIYWLRDGASPTVPFCTETGAQITLLGLQPDIYQFVYLTTAVRQHSTI
jgi:prepilin-type N-terminal cleavage/methylation domain-containing protein